MWYRKNNKNRGRKQLFRLISSLNQAALLSIEPGREDEICRRIRASRRKLTIEALTKLPSANASKPRFSPSS